MLRRFLIFLIGFSIGCLIVYFSLIKGQNRNFTFWFPSDRIKEEVLVTKKEFSDSFLCGLSCLQSDTSKQNLSVLIEAYEIDFSKSLPRESPRTYLFINTTNQSSFKVKIHSDYAHFLAFDSKNCNC